MSGHRVVFGAGLGALRAAVALARRGDAVIWLDPSGGPGVQPELSLERGPWRAPVGDLSAFEDLIGPLRPAARRNRKVSWGGRAVRLPLSAADRLRFVGIRHARAPVDRLLRARVRNVLSEALGGGLEERTYEDWVVRRVGRPLFARRYAAYALRRWGRAPDALSASTARWHHFVPHDDRLVEAADPMTAAEALRAALTSAGGARRAGARIQRLHVEQGRVTAVELVGGERILCAGEPWLALDPAGVAALLDPADLSPDLRVIALRCVNLDRVVVEVPDAEAREDEELHLLDDAPFWAVLRGGGRAQLISTVDPAAPWDAAEHLRRCADACHLMGLALRIDGSAELRRIPGAQPSWSPQTHAYLRDVLLAWERLGIVVFGRQGAMADLDPLEELGHTLALLAPGADGGGPDQREAQRVHAEPSAREDDVLAPIAPFITR